MLRKLLRVLGIVLAAAIVIGAALLLYLEPYVTYDRDGAHLSLKKNAQDPDGTGATAALPEVSDAQIVYDEAQPGSDRIADLGGVYVTTQMLRDPEAVRAALAGGVDSIEHGAYLTDETLCQLAESGAVWVPTLVTIGNLIGCGRFPDEVLTPLLAYQMNAVKKAAAQGAKIACGSDAGAYRVLHGQGGLDERTLLRRAIGEGADTVTDAGNAVIMARF